MLCSLPASGSACPSAGLLCCLDSAGLPEASAAGLLPLDLGAAASASSAAASWDLPSPPDEYGLPDSSSPSAGASSCSAGPFSEFLGCGTTGWGSERCAAEFSGSEPAAEEEASGLLEGSSSEPSSSGAGFRRLALYMSAVQTCVCEAVDACMLASTLQVDVPGLLHMQDRVVDSLRWVKQCNRACAPKLCMAFM